MKWNFLLVLLLHVVVCVDYFKNNYCRVRCKDGSVSSGCNCSVVGTREEIATKMKNFRAVVVFMVNRLRNIVARGGENGFPPAANMMVVNYDLELEHLARCFIVSRFVNGQGHYDRCRQTTYCTKYQPGQSIIEITFKSTKPIRVVDLFMAWYHQRNSIETGARAKVVSRFRLGGGGADSYADFTQMVWATHTRIGCMRGWNNGTGAIWRFVMVCNYAGPDDYCAGNVRTHPVYRAGAPCSRCGAVACNRDLDGIYDSLCGRLAAVPVDRMPAPWDATLPDDQGNVTEDPLNRDTPQMRRMGPHDDDDGDNGGDAVRILFGLLSLSLLTVAAAV